MKKILTLTIAAFAMASAVFAQTEKEMAALETKANAAVDKVAAKVKKAEDAADLKGRRLNSLLSSRLRRRARRQLMQQTSSSRSLHWLILTRKRLTSSVLLSRTV